MSGKNENSTAEDGMSTAVPRLYRGMDLNTPTTDSRTYRSRSRMVSDDGAVTTLGCRMTRTLNSGTSRVARSPGMSPDAAAVWMLAIDPRMDGVGVWWTPTDAASSSEMASGPVAVVTNVVVPVLVVPLWVAWCPPPVDAVVGAAVAVAVVAAAG